MKTILQIIFSITLIFSFFSCKTQSDHGYKQFYYSINKGYPRKVVSVQKEKKIKATSCCDEENALYAAYLDSISNNLGFIVTALDSDEFKTTDSSIANEAIPAQNTIKATPLTPAKSSSRKTNPSPATPTSFKGVQNESSGTSKVANSNKHDSFNDFRRGKVYAESKEDMLLLKKYNVIVATLAKKEGVEILRKSFKDIDENFLVVRNEKGLYYFVIGSFEAQEDAVDKRRQILRQYVDKYSQSTLLNKYGIPFSDMWVLINE